MSSNEIYELFKKDANDNLKDIAFYAYRLVQKAIADKVAPSADPNLVWNVTSDYPYPAELSALVGVLNEAVMRGLLDGEMIREKEDS